MTQEQAQIIADKHLVDFPSREIANYVGLLNNDFLFSYDHKIIKKGHCGRPVFATISVTGKWTLLEDDKDITSAIVFSASLINRNQ